MAGLKSWHSPTPGEKKLFGGLAAMLGVLSAIAQFLSSYIHDGVILFGVCLAAVCLFVGIVMAVRRMRRALFWTVVLFLAVGAGGSAGYAAGRKSAAPAPNPRETLTAPPSTSPPLTHDEAITLAAEPAGRRSVRIKVQKRREPARDNSFWLVVQIHNMNGHSEFYPGKDLSRAPSSLEYTSTLDDGSSLVNPRTARVYEVDRTTAGKLLVYKEKRKTIPLDELIRPPCDDCSVSNEADLPFRE